MSTRFPEYKSIWREHCLKHYVPLYLQAWWNDIVCENNYWDVCLAMDKAGRVDGALVFHKKRIWGLPVIQMPPLTTYSGLWISGRAGDQKPSTLYAFEKKVANQLIRQLPRVKLFSQNWHPPLSNFLPFYWNGFRSAVRYTYLHNYADKTFKFNRRVMRNVKNTENRVTLTTSDEIGTLYDLYRETIAARGLKIHFSLPMLKKLDEELRSRGQCRLLIARDNFDRIQAAAYFIWDDKVTYSVLSGTSAAFKGDNALTLLFVNAISQNYGNSIYFDLEGSMNEGVEEFLRSFGGRLTPYFQVRKESNKILEIANNFFGNH